MALTQEETDNVKELMKKLLDCRHKACSEQTIKYTQLQMQIEDVFSTNKDKKISLKQWLENLERLCDSVPLDYIIDKTKK